jgi:hypothetical protein
VDSGNERGMTSSKIPARTAGFGAQSHGNRKGLGGDPPNAPVKGATPRRADEATQAQIADMQSEGQGQTDTLPDQPARLDH